MKPQNFLMLDSYQRNKFLRQKGLFNTALFVERAQPVRHVLEGLMGINSLSSTSRKREVVWARMLFSRYMIDKDWYPSYEYLGTYLGVDRTTVIHYNKASRDLIKFDKEFKEKYNQFLELL